MKSWRAFSAEQIGPLHVKQNLPMQDSHLFKYYSWGFVAVVSDGLGSKKYSQIGSSSVCKSVCKWANIWSKHKELCFNDILRFIYSDWVMRVSPKVPSDCACTVLICICIHNTVFFAQLGDGMICFNSNDDSTCPSDFIVDDKNDSFSNMTDAFSNTFDLNKFITKKIDAKYLKSIVMTTDGVSDDIKPNLRIDFTKSISEECCQNSSRKNNSMLKKMLIEWSVPKHSDDKTIIVIINKTRFQEEKK